MGFRPMPNIETTLIKFKQGNRLDYIKNVDSINKYLDGTLLIGTYFIVLFYSCIIYFGMWRFGSFHCSLGCSFLVYRPAGVGVPGEVWTL